MGWIRCAEGRRERRSITDGGWPVAQAATAVGVSRATAQALT